VRAKEGTMSIVCRILACALPLLTAALLAAPAGAFDLNGAWATAPSLCRNVFKKQGDNVVLTTTSDLYGGGFIIEGNHVRGKFVTCNIESNRQDGSTIHLSVACTTEIATEQIQFDLKIVNDTTVAKMFPETNIAMDYHRCTL
jgi:hypothetical protein